MPLNDKDEVLCVLVEVERLLAPFTQKGLPMIILVGIPETAATVSMRSPAFDVPTNRDTMMEYLDDLNAKLDAEQG